VVWSEALPLLIVGFCGAVLVMIVLWFIQRRTGNAGIVDFGWAGILGALALLYGALGEGWAPRRALISICGGIWGFRLAWHLLRDRVWRQPEDGRYVTLRTKWTPRADRAFFVFFQAQAVLALYLSLPFLLAAFDARDAWSVVDGIGAALWLAGITGEAVADQQLRRWKADPANRGKTCRAGLWRASRHPNYFFEWVIWCGFAVLALGNPWGWLGLLAPATLLFFILKVTGIPPTEAQALKSRGEDYRRYQRTTSPFFPWFSKKERTA
jgi:steroid 5-alpha reductase family enzyme